MCRTHLRYSEGDHCNLQLIERVLAGIGARVDNTIERAAEICLTVGEYEAKVTEANDIVVSIDDHVMKGYKWVSILYILVVRK